jgi:hypothetical protein
MDTIIKTLNHSMSVDIIAKLAFLFNSTIFSAFPVLIEKEWALQKSLHLIELNTKHQFTVTRDFVI